MFATAILIGSGKGRVRRYVAKMTGLSRAQSTRLIGQYAECCEVKEKVYGAIIFAGTRLGPYEIPIAVGAGGMGEIYRARVVPYQ